MTQRFNPNDFGALDNESLRSVNESIVLNLIRERQPISRVDLARLTHLKQSTISSIINSLLGEHLVYEADLGDSSGGRKPRMLRINGNRSVAIGIHVGVRNTEIALGNFNGEILASCAIRTGKDPCQLLPRLPERIDGLLRQHDIPAGRMDGIGVSLPGLLDRSVGKIIYSANLGWRNIEVGAYLRQYCDCDFVFEDDVPSAALAEIWLGALATLRQYHIRNVTVNEGVGTAIIIGGPLYRGASLGAGQFGHVSLFPGGPVCDCGNRGCWELYASNTATVDRYLRYSSNGQHIARPTVAELADRVADGDEAAIRAIRKAGHYLGMGLAILVNALDPEMIVIHGEINRAWNVIEHEIWDVIRARALARNYSSLRLEPSSLKANPSLMGAISLVICRRFAVPHRPKGREIAPMAAGHINLVDP